MDYRKTLPVLEQEWNGCTRCELGHRRVATGGSFVFGEGRPGGILFVGEGPGKEEEAHGRPFIGPSGRLLRDILTRYRFEHYYITNLVSCRSCEPWLDENNNPRMTRSRPGGPLIPKFRDQVPTPPQIAACRQRLIEEIYMVDPIVIVALGASAAGALLQENSVAITTIRGRFATISISGATSRASLTDKRNVWSRRVGGTVQQPTVPNEVNYLLMPTLHPAFVLRKIGNQDERSDMAKFASDIATAIRVYERYSSDLLGREAVSFPQEEEIDLPEEDYGNPDE
jgi:uracil-DNA glycosylase